MRAEEGLTLKDRLAKAGPLPWLILVVFIGQFFALSAARNYGGEDCHGCGVQILLLGFLWLALVVLLVVMVILWVVSLWRSRH